jgi:hypothetical protein
VSGSTAEDASAITGFVAENRTALAIGASESARKAQSRIEQFKFYGVPVGTEIRFSTSRLNELPMITLSITADTQSMRPVEEPLSCGRMLNLLRYILAEHGTTYYSQKIQQREISLGTLDATASQQACDAIVMDLSVALDGEGRNDLRDLSGFCSKGVAIEAMVGPSGSRDVAHCIESLQSISQ